MKIFQSIQLLSCVAMSLLSVDVHSSGSEESKSESDRCYAFNATVIPANQRFNVMPQPSGPFLTMTLSDPVVRYNEKYFLLGRQVSFNSTRDNTPVETRTVTRDVFCCGCLYQDSIGVGTSVLWFQGRCCFAIALECLDCVQCCCRRTIEYEVEMER